MRFSLYGGVGRVAEAASRIGHHGIGVDQSIHVDNDMTNSVVHQEVLSCINSGLVRAVCIDIVCSTWSRARRAPPGLRMPQPLRGVEGRDVYGLPGLVGNDAIKVRQGNRMLRNAVAVIRLPGTWDSRIS